MPNPTLWNEPIELASGEGPLESTSHSQEFAASGPPPFPTSAPGPEDNSPPAGVDQDGGRVWAGQGEGREEDEKEGREEEQHEGSGFGWTSEVTSSSVLHRITWAWRHCSHRDRRPFGHLRSAGTRGRCAEKVFCFLKPIKSCAGPPAATLQPVLSFVPSASPMSPRV